jgi:methyltransferase-like protein 6
MGCGVGNTLFPLKKNYPFFKKVYGFDFSKKAIDVIKTSEFYKEEDFEVCVIQMLLMR